MQITYFASLLSAFLIVPYASAQDKSKQPITKLIQALQSKDTLTVRLAQVHLAHHGDGPAVLLALEKTAATAPKPVQQRLVEVLALKFLQNDPRDAQNNQTWKRIPKLHALLDTKTNSATKTAKMLFGAKNYDSGAVGLAPPGAPKPPVSKQRKIMNKLRAMHGFAVPVAVQLCNDKSPASRMYGAELLLGLQAIAQLESLQKLANDQTPIAIFFGDYTDRTTVGKQVGRWLKSNSLLINHRKPHPKYGVCFAIEPYVTWMAKVEFADKAAKIDLVNPLRQKGKTITARSWEEFWQRAEPVLRNMWPK